MAMEEIWDPNSQQEAKELEMIKLDPKVKRALDDCSIPPTDERKAKAVSKGLPLIGIGVFVIIVCGALYYLLGWQYFPIRNRYVPLAQKVLLGIIATTLILFLARLTKKLLNRKVEDATTRFNLNRITDLIAAVIIFTLLLSLLFANWYATMVSFGIISLILGLALQNPITSFFGWIYILVRKPYEVGDRIKIGTVKGDVIDLGYFDTTLWEFGGEYLSGDHPSGRIIRFANSKVFSEYVYNYSWPLFPFIWNEMKLFVSYESDFGFVSETVQSFVEKEVGEAMTRRVKRFKKILEETPIDQLEVREVPSIILRAHDNTWVEVVVRYLVEPKASGQVKNRIFKNLMAELSKYPEKVMLPKTNMR